MRIVAPATLSVATALALSRCYRVVEDQPRDYGDACDTPPDGPAADHPEDGGPGGPLCDPGELRDALARAAPGDTVRVGACRIVGSFTVPPGVALVGQGREASTLVTAGLSPALRLTPGIPASRAADLSIASDAHSGILVRGDGEARLERVDVAATRGIGLAAQDVGVLVLSDVGVRGPVTRENESSFGMEPSPADTSTHGMVLANVRSAELSEVTVGGFASCGAMLVDSSTSWQGGGAVDNLWRGVVAYGGSARMEGADLSGTLGEFLLLPAAGGVFAGGASVETRDLRVSEGHGLGLVHDDVSARHVDLVAEDNGDAAVWVEDCPSFELSGTGTEIARNGLGGVVLVDSGAATIMDARVSQTVLVRRTFGETGTVELGAGLEFVRPGGPVVLRGVTLSRNEQVGLLVQLADTGTTDALMVDGVAVDGLGTAFGAVAQGGTVLPGWDAGIARDAVTLGNDAAPHPPLPVVRRLGPEALAADAAAVSADGLAAIIDPEPDA